MTDIVERYQNALDDIIGRGRLTVRIIHDEEDLCIVSNERELLYTIQNVQREQFGVEWQFRENMLGKCITIPLEQQVSPLFNGFAEQYKILFQKRITMIANRYDVKSLDEEKNEFYKQVNALYFDLLKYPVVDFHKYKQVRDLFERVRY